MRSQERALQLVGEYGEGAIIGIQDVADSTGQSYQAAAGWLRLAVKSGYVDQHSRGRYRLPGMSAKAAPTPVAAPTAKVQDDGALIGVPMIGNRDPEVVRLALVALLESGRHLARLLGDDKGDGSALEEYIHGVLRDHSRHAAILRLVLDGVDDD